MEEQVKSESDEYYVVIVGELEDKSAVTYDVNDHRLTDEGSLEADDVWLDGDSVEVKIEHVDTEPELLEIKAEFSNFKEEPLEPDEQDWEEGVMEYVRAMEAHAKASPPPLPHKLFTKEDGQYECVYCEHSSSKEFLAIKHYRFRHGEKYHKCLACNTAFRRHDSMVFHEHHCRAENADLVRMARARIGRVIRSKRKSPRLAKSERQRRKVSCPICSRLICYGNIWTHMRVHSEIKRFECSLCTASFRTKRAKEAHENAHSGVRPYRCTQCPNAYTSTNGLQAHILTHSECGYSCEHCGHMFRKKHTLKEHVLTRHTGVNTYLCNDCGKVLHNKTSLEYHTRAHRGNLPKYTCEVCGTSYTSLTSLNSHMKAKHGHEIITQKMFFKRMPLMAHVPDYMLELIPEEKGKHSDTVGEADSAKEVSKSGHSSKIKRFIANGTVEEGNDL